MSARRTLLQTSLAATFFPASVWAKLAATASVRPLNTILVCSGHYYRYQKIFRYFARELETQHIIEEGDFFHHETDFGTRKMWSVLSRHAGGEKLNFLADGHYSYDFFNKEARLEVLPKIKERLASRRDVDLILTFGSEASLDMKALVKDKPILALDSSSPLASGLIRSSTNSGQSNFHARYDPTLLYRQLQSFRHFCKFKRLGLPITQDYRAITDLKQIKDFCAKAKIELILEEYSIDRNDATLSFENFFAALQRTLQRGAEAVYLLYFTSNSRQFRKVVDLLIDKRIPSYSQTGSDPVRCGLLLGEGSQTLKNYAIFEAWVLSQILQGKKPGKLPLVFEAPTSICVNLKTATLMNWIPDLSMITVASDTFTTIPSSLSGF